MPRPRQLAAALAAIVTIAACGQNSPSDSGIPAVEEPSTPCPGTWTC